MNKWQIVRHVSGTCWFIYRDGNFFCSYATRADAREYVRQQRALDAQKNQTDEMITDFLTEREVQ